MKKRIKKLLLICRIGHVTLRARGTAVWAVYFLIFAASFQSAIGEVAPDAIRIEAISSSSVDFVVGHNRFHIPRQYVASIPEIGPAWGEMLCATFPDFQPIPNARPICWGKLSSQGRGRFSATVRFNIPAAGNHTTLESWKFVKDAVNSQTPTMLSPSIGRYTEGPPGSRVDFYKWSSTEGPGAASCISFEPGIPKEGACEDNFVLDPDIILEIQFPESGILLAPEMESGFRRLLKSFEVKS